MRKRSGSTLNASLNYEQIILSMEETTSGGRCGFSLAAFHALRQPAQVAECRGAFFYRWKEVGGYESDLHLPQLRGLPERGRWCGCTGVKREESRKEAKENPPQ